MSEITSGPPIQGEPVRTAAGRSIPNIMARSPGSGLRRCRPQNLEGVGNALIKRVLVIGRLQAIAGTKFVHCGQKIPQNFRLREIAAGKVRLQKAKRAALILVLIGLILLTWTFWNLGY